MTNNINQSSKNTNINDSKWFNLRSCTFVQVMFFLSHVNFFFRNFY